MWVSLYPSVVSGLWLSLTGQVALGEPGHLPKPHFPSLQNSNGLCEDRMKRLGGGEESVHSDMLTGTRELQWQEPALACCLAGACPEAALLQAQQPLGPWSRHLLWPKACPSCTLALSLHPGPAVTVCPQPLLLHLCTVTPGWPAPS